MGCKAAFHKGICLLLLLLLGLLLPALGVAATENIFPKDGLEITAMAPAGDGGLYLLRYDGLYLRHPDGQQTLVSADVSGDWDKPGYLYPLLSGPGGLYGITADQDALQLVVSLDGRVQQTPVLALEESGNMRAAWLDTDAFCMVEITPSGKHALQRFPLNGGAANTIDLPDVVTACGGKPGEAYLVVEDRSRGVPAWHIATLSIPTGDITPLLDLPWITRSIAYDAAADRLYLAGPAGQLYRYTPAAGLVLDSYILKGDVVVIVPLGNGVTATMVDSAIAIRDGQLSAQKTLRIYLPEARSEDYRTYLTAHPDTELVFPEMGRQSAEEVYQEAIITGDDTWDIFALTDVNLLPAIKRKGAAVELSAHAPLRAVLDTLYPPYQGLLGVEDTYYALPVSLFIETLGIVPDFFADHQLEKQIPATYENLYRLVEQWATGAGSDQPQWSMNPLHQGGDLTTALIRHVDACAAAGVPLTYHTPAWISTLEYYLAARDALRALPDAEQEERAFAYTILPRAKPYTLLPLSLSAETPPVLGIADMDMTYLVINPHSKQVDAALAFLADVPAAWDSGTRALLQATVTAPIASADYVQAHARLQAELAEWKAAPDADGQAEAIADLEAQLAEIESFRYDVSEGDLQLIQRTLPMLHFHLPNPTMLVLESNPDWLPQLEAGEMTPDVFLQLLDQRIAMVLQEQQ